MNTTRHWNIETELSHWLLILVAALALAIIAVTALGGADPTKEPQLLPKGIDTFAKPMPLESVKPFSQSRRRCASYRRLKLRPVCGPFLKTTVRIDLGKLWMIGSKWAFRKRRPTGAKSPSVQITCSLGI
jgi:hypothetical protein